MKLPLRGYSFFILLLTVFLFACTQGGTVNTGSASQQFFDLKGYFESEVERLNKSGNSRAKKTVVADGKTEERIIDSVDFQRELGFFAGSDINRPAWSDKYVVDTLLNELNQIIQLSYKCNDEKLKIRKIVIEFDGQEVSKVFIENNTSNSIATSSQVLVYQPAIGYSIESHQKVAMGDEELFKVEVKF